MTEHHEGHIHLTGHGGELTPPPKKDVPAETEAPKKKVVPPFPDKAEGEELDGPPPQMNPTDIMTIANIWLEAGRKMDAYARSRGWKHHPTIDMLRNAPNTSAYYDGAFHGQPDITLEQAQKSYDDVEELTRSKSADDLEALIRQMEDKDPGMAEFFRKMM